MNELKRIGLDRCGYHGGAWSFYNLCHADIAGGMMLTGDVRSDKDILHTYPYKF
jgi:hypothetical protein